MTQTTTEKVRHIEWIGTIEKQSNGNKLVATFYKQKIKTGETKGTPITTQQVEVLNRGLLDRPGTFHTIWIPDTKENRKSDPIKLNPADFEGPQNEF